MSTFPISPRPHIVNGVLIPGCRETKRHNGLQGTSSKEDLYCSISKMASPVPDTDISRKELVSSSYDIPCNRSQRHNYPNPKNTSTPSEFAHEQNNMSGQSANVTHCDHGQLSEPRESESETSQRFTHSNFHSRSRGNQLHTRVEQGTNICCEGSNLMHKVEWESGDHHRSTADNSLTLNDESCPHASNPGRYDAIVACNSNHLKYPHQENSPKNARSDPPLAECQENIHQGHSVHGARIDPALKECQEIMHESRSLCSARRDPPFEDCHENTQQGRAPCSARRDSLFEECQENIHQGHSPCNSGRDPVFEECQENICQGRSSRSAIGDPTFEKCQENVHRGRSPHTRRDPVIDVCQECLRHRTGVQPRDQNIADDKSIYRTSKSIRLHEACDSSANSENCHILTNAEDTCNPQNALQDPLSKENCRPTSDEQPEYNQYIARETPSLRESQDFYFSGYPPQRISNRKQYNSEEGSGDLIAVMQHGQQSNVNIQEPQVHLQRKGKKQREASSVAEIFNHPIWEVHPDYSEASERQHAPSLRNPVSEEAAGYPAQLAPLGKSKYTVHKAHESEAQREELQQYGCNIGQTQVSGELNYSRPNEPPMCADCELKQIHVSQRNGPMCEVYGGNESCCRTYNNHFQHQNLIDKERERALAHEAAQVTVDASPKHCERKSCVGPRNVHSMSQENYYQNHHCSETPDGKLDHPSFGNRKPSDHQQYYIHQNDEIAHRKNKEIHGGNNVRSFRSPACHEDEPHRAENKQHIRAPEHQHNNSVPSNPDNYKNAPEKTENVLQGTEVIQAEVAEEKCYAHGTPVPTTEPYNNSETEHTTANDSCEYSKATEGLQESVTASCHFNNPGDDIVPCHAEQLCSPDKDPSELPSPNRPRITELHRRRNGIDFEDQVRMDFANIPIYPSVNNDVRGGAKKHRMLILQDARQSGNRQNKCTMPSKENSHSAADERKAPPSFTSKTGIPKAKACAPLSSHKGNKTSGNPQRPMRTTGHNQIS